MADPVAALRSDGGMLTPLAVNYGPAATLAALGTVIANAAPIVSRLTKVTGADDAKGVILPATAAPGDEFLIYSNAATAGLKVWPHVNGTINDGAANAAVVQEGKSLGRYINMDGTNWASSFVLNA